MAFPFQVIVNDPNNLGGSDDPLLVTDMNAALQEWSQYISSPGTLTVEINLASSSSPTGISSSFGGQTIVGTFDNGAAIIDPASTYLLDTGQQIPGVGIDIVVNVDPSKLSDLFLNPSPGNGAPVPSNQVDAVSAFAREIARGLGVNGYYQPDGTLGAGGAYETIYDAYVAQPGGGVAYFDGPLALNVYGGLVPLTTTNTVDPTQNYYSFGNSADPLADPLVGDLLNGVTFATGTSYGISPLDLAVLKQIDIPVTGTVTPGAAGVVFIPPASGPVETAGQSVVLGGGSLNVLVSGEACVVYGGSGPDLLTVAGADDIVVFGTGAGTAFATGPNQIILDGAGPDTDVVLGANAIVVGGTGADVVYAAGPNTTCFGGPQQMTFVNATSSPATFVAGQGTGVVFAGVGGMTAFDGPGRLILVGGDSASTVVSNNGNDVIYGANGGTINLYGNGSNNILIGAGGTETLNAAGATGNNAFFAGPGVTNILGGSGGNFIEAGTGNATMTAGSGPNIFAFVAGQAGGTDLIMNFNAGDSLDLIGYAGNAIQEAVASQVVANGSTSITLPDNTSVILAGVSGVNASNFQAGP